MRLKIYPNYFAPKCADRNEKYDTRNSHAIYFLPCNFKCSFCKHGIITETTNNDISLSEFDNTVQFLMLSSTMFKFTGGEPTLIPELRPMLEIVKKHHGTVFLDSNGSRSKIIRPLIEDNLVDVLGISIKGLSPQAAELTSGVKRNLCWDSVWDTIRLTQGTSVRLIITFVVYSGIDVKDMLSILELIHSINNSCYFKINNLYGDIHRNSSLLPLTSVQLDSLRDEILTKKPEWKGKLIIVENFDSVSNYESIKFY